VHSEGTEDLGFMGPQELDPAVAGPGPGGVQSQLIVLLNESTQGTDFHPLP
jgi:hypothetical protein